MGAYIFSLFECILDFIEAYIGIFGALIGAITGSLFTSWIFQKKDEKRKKRKKELFTVLLGDEIILRWNGTINSAFGNCFNEKRLTDSILTKNIYALSKFKFNESDLFIFNQIAVDLNAVDYFQSKTKISRIVYIHVLTRDLADQLKILVEINLNSPNEKEKIKNAYRHLKKSWKEVHKEMNGLFENIQEEYITYLGINVSRKTLNLKTEERMSKIAKIRENNP